MDRHVRVLAEKVAAHLLCVRGTADHGGSNKFTERPRLFGDRPTESEDHDTIGRRGFAAQIRREIKDAPRDQGLVIGVTGQWGAGRLRSSTSPSIPLPTAAATENAEPFEDLGVLPTESRGGGVGGTRSLRQC